MIFLLIYVAIAMIVSWPVNKSLQQKEARDMVAELNPHQDVDRAIRRVTFVSSAFWPLLIVAFFLHRTA